MKQILCSIVFMLTILPSLTKGNVALGQNMASESYNPWTEADETGFFDMTRCEICDEFIVSYKKEDVEKNKKKHKETKHPFASNDEDNDNSSSGEGSGTSDSSGSTGNSGSSGSTGNSGNTSSNNYTKIVNLYDVAYALETIGVYNANWFIQEYDIYCGQYVEPKITVMPNYLDTFIRRVCHPLNVGLSTAINGGYSFVLLANPPSTDYRVINGKKYSEYKVFTNYTLHDANNVNGNYIYVFW